jgi:opacity protein-like surface antigen
MKRIHLLAIALSPLLCSSVFAGPPTIQQSTPVDLYYGTGFYLGVDLGANVYQDRGGDFTLVDGLGNRLDVSPTNDVGFVGGIKAGYVFGTGVVRPTIEADLFYNGYHTGFDATLTDAAGVVTTTNADELINTGAFMSNLRFAPGGQRFQPYIGGGVGVYYAESAGGNVGPFQTSGGSSHTDFAWQAIAGADYYYNPRASVFVEYKYLSYTSTQSDFQTDRELGQQLVTGGLRFHF